MLSKKSIKIFEYGIVFLLTQDREALITYMKKRHCPVELEFGEGELYRRFVVSTPAELDELIEKLKS